MDAHTATLLQRAADDEASLHWPGLPEVPFGQHAQGAVEKLLKALINERGQSYPYTHDIEELVDKLFMLGEPLPQFGVTLGDLSDYAMSLRYEDDAHLPPPLDRRACLEAVELPRAHVAGRIQALNPPPAANGPAAP